MQNFFVQNEGIVYAVYGLVFIILGVAIAVQSLHHSRIPLARCLWLLALFGMLHGLTEWGYVFIPVQATYLPPAAIEWLKVGQYALMISSSYFLLLFGLYLSGGYYEGHRRRVNALVAGTATVWLTSLVVFRGWSADYNAFMLAAKTLSRYFFVFPGAVLGAYGLFRQARQIQGMGLASSAGGLRLAAVGLGAYSILGGLVARADGLPLSRWLNYNILNTVLPIPMPLFRSAAILLLVIGIIRGLEVFRVEMDRLLEEARAEKLLVAERELAALSGIGVLLGQPGGPSEVAANALDRVLEMLKLDQGVVAVLATGPAAESGTEMQAPLRILAQRQRCASTCLDAQFEQQVVLADKPARMTTATGGEQIAVPLRAAGRVVGVMTLVSPRRLDLTAENLQLLEGIGHQIGVAAENARLWEEVRQKEALRGRLLQKVISAQEEERRRIARDLHDATAQLLSGLIMRLGSAIEVLPERQKRLHGILTHTQEQAMAGLQELRAFIGGLRPATLDDLGLVAAVRRLLQELGERHRLKTHLEATGMTVRLPEPVETALFRVVQEALANVGKHAGAQNVRVILTLADGRIHAQVADDGRGFDDKNLLGGVRCNHALGLLGMQERTELLGGAMSIHSQPGHGTRIDVQIPIADLREGEQPAAQH